MKSNGTKRNRLSISFALSAVVLLMPAVLAAQDKIAFSSTRDGMDMSEIKTFTRFT
jgi:hypothetical protein